MLVQSHSHVYVILFLIFFLSISQSSFLHSNILFKMAFYFLFKIDNYKILDFKKQHKFYCYIKILKVKN